jgi:mono/diheme cytochrome c family protein
MDWRKLLPLTLPMILVGLSQVGSAQAPTYGIGRTPSADEVRAWDISISPTGTELPPGHGTAKEGATLYTQKGCAGCHGPDGSGAGADADRGDGTAKRILVSRAVNDTTDGAALAIFTAWDYQPRQCARKDSLKRRESRAHRVPAVQERRHQEHDGDAQVCRRS